MAGEQLLPAAEQRESAPSLEHELNPWDAQASRFDFAAKKLNLDSGLWKVLRQPCREIIELRYFGDLGYEEISELLQLNPKTVSSRLSKCLDKLEEVVKKTFVGENSRVLPSNQ